MPGLWVSVPPLPACETVCWRMAMVKMQTLFGGVINAYLHGLTSFRGKWRLLQWMEPLLRGTPVRSPYGPVPLRLYPDDRTKHHRDRKSCWTGKRVSARVEEGGGR